MTLAQLRYVVAVSEAGSMNEAAKRLYITQPSLSAAIKELEEEIGLRVFRRTNRGITVTPEGQEFIGYAMQMISQFELMESRYIGNEMRKEKFAVSTQHYTFAVEAFVKMVKCFGMENYEFAIKEGRTSDVLEDVRDFVSEIGILYLDSFNEKFLRKLFREYNIEFHELFKCRIYAYLWKGHPLAKKEIITLIELSDYPCLSFDQGRSNAFYFAEEVLSTYDYKQLIKVNDRSTMLNLMKGLNGYTLCSGIICEELNGEEYCAVRLDSEEEMTIGYLARKGVGLSRMGQIYVEEIMQYQDKVY